MAEQSTTPFDQGLFLVHLNRGRELFDKRNFADAAEELEEARRLRPEDDAVLNLLGLAYFKQEKYRKADAVYRKLIELNPESYTLHFNLGLVCFKNGDLDQAETIFLRALELKPDNQKTHFYLGNIYEKKRQYYNAIFQYRKAGANIMVKRVQEKIDHEQPDLEREQKPDEDFVLSAEDSASSPKLEPPGEAPDESSPALEKVNVDHLDRSRFLTALQEGLFTAKPKKSESSDAGAERERAPGPRAALDTSPDLGPRRVKPADTQEEVLSSEEQTVIASAIDDLTSSTERTIPPPTERTIPPSSGSAGRSGVRVTTPEVPDKPLDRLASEKIPASASEALFTGRSDAQPTDDASEPARSAGPPSREAPSPEQSGTWGTRESGGFDNLYARMRRRDDIFRYLESNLIEVNFSGKVFIKQGTIYSYSGNLTFWVKPPREEGAPSLVIVSGTGKLLLTDRQRDITVMRINDEEVFVEPSHLLACQETLTPRYAVVEDKDGKPGMHVLMIKGTGVLALSVATSPLLVTVQKEYPINVSSRSLISWSGQLSPAIVQDDALAEIMLPGVSSGVNLRLEGEGRVMMEKSSPDAP